MQWTMLLLRGTELIHAAISLLIQDNVTCSKTRPGCGDTNLVSTLGVTQPDPPPPPPASFEKSWLRPCKVT